MDVFLLGSENTCTKCSQKDINELSILSNYLVDIDDTVSLEDISQNTGISVKNINRIMKNNNFSQDNINFNGNISINL